MNFGLDIKDKEMPNLMIQKLHLFLPFHLNVQNFIEIYHFDAILLIRDRYSKIIINTYIIILYPVYEFFNRIPIYFLEGPPTRVQGVAHLRKPSSGTVPSHRHALRTPLLAHRKRTGTYV